MAMRSSFPSPSRSAGTTFLMSPDRERLGLEAGDRVSLRRRGDHQSGHARVPESHWESMGVGLYRQAMVAISRRQAEPHLHRDGLQEGEVDLPSLDLGVALEGFVLVGREFSSSPRCRSAIPRR